MPHRCKNARINKSNSSVIYRYYQKAWMLTGVWYEYWSTFNDNMKQKDPQIALVADNCSSHPWPNELPNSGYGSPS